MAIQIQGNGGNIAEVDGTTFRAQRVAGRPVDYATLGSYRLAMASGVIAAALAASGQVFQFRWADASRLAVIHSIRLQFRTLTLFTAATLTDFGFDAYVARSCTASGSGGTAATLTGNNMKTRTSMGTTLLTDARISSTAALTAVTATLDGNAFAVSRGRPQRTNPAAATEEQIEATPELIYAPDVMNGEHPLVLAQNEGFVLRNRTVWPAAGTGSVYVQVAWSEVNNY